MNLGRHTLVAGVVIAVVVFSDQRPRRVVEPQVRIGPLIPGHIVGTRGVAVPVDGHLRVVRIDREVPVGFLRNAVGGGLC